MRAALGPVLAALVVVATLGVVHGTFTDRWGPSGQLRAAVDGLGDRVPKGFGDWVLKEEVPLEDEVLARGGIRGYMQRRYRNPRTGEEVTALIVCGRGGPISVHTPDVCYTGAGYRMVGEKRAEVDAGGGRTASFTAGRFAMPDAVVPTELEIYWAWSADGADWQVPENPRRALAREPVLYKMYVVRDAAPKGKTEGADGCAAFLRSALPDLRQTLPAGR